MEKSPIKFIWRYLVEFRLYVILGMIFVSIEVVASRLTPYYLAKIFDGLGKEVVAWDLIYIFVFIVVLTRVVMYISTFFASCVGAIYGGKSKAKIMSDVFAYVTKHSISYFNEKMSGNISVKINQVVGDTSGFYSFLLRSSGVFLSVLYTIVAMLMVDVLYFPGLIIWILASVYISYKMTKKSTALAKNRANSWAEAGGLLVDDLANYSEVRNFSNRKFEMLNLFKKLNIFKRLDIKENLWVSKINFLQFLSIAFFYSSCLIFSVYLFKLGRIDVVGFIFVNSIFHMVSYSIFSFQEMLSKINRVRGSLGSALDILSVEHEVKDREDAINLKLENATIEFCDVKYQYKNKDFLFDNLNINISSGQRVGVVGYSGAGKSTLIKLLLRYFDLKEGSIKIGGFDIRDITQISLNENISLMPQDVNLFNRTIFENIRYGKNSATREEVIGAAKKAYIHGFIMSLPEGYDTIVGDRGILLSGGEKQRVAIARAILKNAPILIFDEATSSLDSVSEKYIQKSLKELIKGKTVISIAHRLSTLKEMDRIIVLENGKIVEDGSQKELLKNKKGIFYKLYNMQSDGILVID